MEQAGARRVVVNRRVGGLEDTGSLGLDGLNVNRRVGGLEG